MKARVLSTSGWILLSTGLFLILLGMVLEFAVAPAFRATVRIKIEKEHSDIPSLRDRLFDPYWLQNELEAIQSKSVLYPVISDLNLATRWARRFPAGAKPSVEEVFSRLKSDLEVGQYRGTSVFEISVSSQNRLETAEIANAIAASVLNVRGAERQSEHRHAISGLEKELQKQRESLQISEAELSNLQSSGRAEVAIDEKQRDIAKARGLCEQIALVIQREKNATVTSGVILIDPAKPPLEPVRPTRALINTFLGSGVSAVAIGALLLFYSRTVKRRAIAC